MGRTWNCKSSSFWASLRELRNPGLRSEKEESSGANMVRPPDLVETSWELIWFMSCVIFRRRMNVLKDLAFLRTPMMSVEAVGVSGVLSEGGCGNVGTKAAGGVAVGVAAGAAFVGAIAGD